MRASHGTQSLVVRGEETRTNLQTMLVLPLVVQNCSQLSAYLRAMKHYIRASWRAGMVPIVTKAALGCT